MVTMSEKFTFLVDIIFVIYVNNVIQYMYLVFCKSYSTYSYNTLYNILVQSSYYTYDGSVEL
jgi:hypothetical protein